MHPSSEELNKKLQAAARHVQVGSHYHHYKNQKDTYKVIHIGITEWNDEICIIYQAQYGDNFIFVRPLASWLEPVQWHGKTVPRFTLAH